MGGVGGVGGGGGPVPGPPSDGFGGRNIASGVRIVDALHLASLEGVKFSFQNKENIRTLIDSYGALAREKRDAITFLLAEVREIAAYFADPVFTPSDQQALGHLGFVAGLAGGQVTAVNQLNAVGDYEEANDQAANFGPSTRLGVLSQAMDSPMSTADGTGTQTVGDAFPNWEATYLNLVATAPQPPPTPNPGGTPNPIPPHPQARDYSAAHAYLNQIAAHAISLQTPYLADLAIHNSFIDRRNAIEPQQKLVERLVLSINRDQLFEERLETIGETSSRFAVEKTQGTLEAEGVEDAKGFEAQQGGGGTAGIGLLTIGTDLSADVGAVADQALLKEQEFYARGGEDPVFVSRSVGVDTAGEDASSVTVRDDRFQDARDKNARLFDKAKSKIEMGKVIQGLTSDQYRALKQLGKGDVSLERKILEGFAGLSEAQRNEALKTLLGDVAFASGINEREIIKSGGDKTVFGNLVGLGNVKSAFKAANKLEGGSGFFADVKIVATDQQQADLLVQLTGLPADTAAAVIGGQAKADLGGLESQEEGGHTSQEGQVARALNLDDDESPAAQEIEENLEMATLRRRKSLLKQLPAEVQALEILNGDILSSQILVQDTSTVLAEALKRSITQSQQAVQDSKPPIRPNTVEAELQARETLADELRKLAQDPDGSDVIRDVVADRIQGNEQVMKAIGDQALARVEQRNAVLASDEAAKEVGRDELSRLNEQNEQDRKLALANLQGDDPNKQVGEDALKAELVKIEATRLAGAVASALIDQVRALTLSAANRIIEDALEIGKKQVVENEEDEALGTIIDKEDTSAKDLVERLEVLQDAVQSLNESVTKELEVVHLDQVTRNFDVFMEKHEEVDKFLANFIDPGVNIVEGWAMTNELPQEGRPELHFEA